MKKILPIVLIGVLVLSGLGTAAFTNSVSKDQAMNVKTQSTSVVFSSQPTISEKDEFVKIQLDGATTQLSEPNKPVLPIYVKTIQIPFRSTDIQVMCTPKDIGSLTLSKEVIPARITPVSSFGEQSMSRKDASVYESSAFYPAVWWSYELGAGRNEQDQQVTFVKVICYPVRYSPLNHEISYAHRFDFQVKYTEPIPTSQPLSEKYDMVVIAPEKFYASLQPLVDFKNSKGISTRFKSVESILNEYDGDDPPEQVKYFIKNEYDQANITYVLLVGGLKSHIYAKDKDTRSAGYSAWWVPVRYVNIPLFEDPGCISDLYYGCLYNGTGGFDNWDSNHDGVYAAWNASGAANDTFDLNPEVYVSRLPCTTIREVKTVVKKIIAYESSGPDAKPWYNTFVGIGGKTYAYYQGKPDGEYLCDLAYNITKNALPDLQLVSCYSTNRDTGRPTPTPKDILKSINQGASFVYFEGHGNPYSWNTIWFDGTYPINWTGGFNIASYPLLINGDKQPVVIVGACHNALFNVSLIPALLENKAHHPHFCYGIPIPYCFCAGLLMKTHGGAIATTGCTGYSLGSEDEGVDDPVTLSGALEINFYWQYGNNNITNLAKIHSQAITKYINEQPIHQLDAFVITNWALFGDPSLKLGGYPS
ncbi:MAG TPA: hypothetical protein DSN98_08005 [Thermoplasmata archaeon]|nr:MAG TPA: hypothetical protein DSN98_08005 [Thermoplasmata archaeon]